MELRTALSLEIGQLHQPVVTSYQLGRLVFRLYQTKSYRGEAIGRLQKDVPARAEYTRLIAALVQGGVLQNTPDVPSSEVFAVLGQDTAKAEDIACCVDPFCYVSHLSAMEYRNGFTDRLPKRCCSDHALPPHIGESLAVERMQKDLGQEAYPIYCEASLPSLRRFRLAKIHRPETVTSIPLHIAIRGPI